MTSPLRLPEINAEIRELEEAEQLLMAEAGFRTWDPLPHQVPPDGDWWGWMIRAGRGSGKTDGASRYIYEHVMGDPCLEGPIPHRVALVAPTIGDAVETAWRQPSSYRSHHPGGKLHTQAGGTIFRWPNGSEAKLFGAHKTDDVDRLRAGGNNCLAHLEELAAWRYLVDAWQQVRFGLRVGPDPRWVASTTPRPRQILKDIEARPDVVVTNASIYDNPHLHEGTKTELLADYEDTTLGTQELLGEYLDRVEGALWVARDYADHRWQSAWGEPRISRCNIGVDPSGGTSETSGWTGIIAAGRLKGRCPCGHRPDQPHYAVLGDCSSRGTPGVRGRAIIACFDTHMADRVVGERNYGGDLVEGLVAEIEQESRVPYEHVNATRGKEVRAGPVAAAYEQGRVHHIGVFERLEDQLVTWSPDAGWSPDRLDALVWAITKLQERRHVRVKRSKYTGQLPTRIG